MRSCRRTWTRNGGGGGGTLCGSGGRGRGERWGGGDEIVPPYVDAYRGAGEWNHLRIVAKGPHVEHWLNGVKVAEYEQGSGEFVKIVSEQKFKQFPKFGTLMKGFIVL